MDWEGESVACPAGVVLFKSSPPSVSSFKTLSSTEVVGQVKEGGHHHSPISLDEPTDLSNPKKKKIPPPLDLSIASSTTSFQPPPTTSHHHNNNHGSPKFTQSDKNLPLRKRWHSWSPVPMNGQEDSSSPSSMLPLYPDHKTGLTSGDQHQQQSAAVSAAAAAAHSQQQQQYHNHLIHHHHPPYSSASPGYGNGGNLSRNWTLDFIPLNGNNNSSNGLQRLTIPTSISSGHTHNNNNNNNHHNSDSLHTPTAFFTPNEPSPKFMNSPIFSYSNPDTSLYQGPFSPIRASSLYPPPSSPFTNLSLNSPLHTPQTPSHIIGNGNNGNGGNNNVGNNSCFNIVPSTLLSPAPSQASTNSLSYEDLHEKSLSFFTPVWSIFMTGTKVRFVSGMNSMDWYNVDFLAQSGESLGLKGEYAPHGLEVRKFVKTSSPKERIRVTFCPVGAPNHPQVEIDCEPGHPFMVDKKGWCALKPEIFQEIYGTQCQPLECGDVCLSLGAARSPSIFIQQHHLQHLHHNQHQQSPQSTTTPASTANSIINGNGGLNLHNNHSNSNGLHLISIKMEPIDEKMIPISILPQNNHHHQLHQLQSMPNSPNSNNNNNNHANINNRKSGGTFASPIALQKGAARGVGGTTPSNKKLKRISTENKFQPGGGGGGSNKNNNNGIIVPGEKVKGRRPMNAFLLFAKDKRPELIQMYPGKDNRSISVLLGEAWQSLALIEREKYASNAKARAEEQKRIHPDCWKRKRSQSTNSQ